MTLAGDANAFKARLALGTAPMASIGLVAVAVSMAAGLVARPL
jgi:hypothetical protein